MVGPLVVFAHDLGVPLVRSVRFARLPLLFILTHAPLLTFVLWSLFRPDPKSHLGSEQASDWVDRYRVFAVATPADKLRIIEAFQAKGHTVVLAGGGHHDVEALALASRGGLGIVMGSTFGSAGVAAEAVALSGSLTALVDLLRAGRRAWDNLQKGAAFMFGLRLAFAGLVIPPLLVSGGRFPLNPLQLIIIEVLSYGALSSFVLEPAGAYSVY